MTNQQLADQLLAQWQLLWPLPPAERMRVIEETRADMEYEEVLQCVSEQMSCVITGLPSPSPSLDRFSLEF